MSGGIYNLPLKRWMTGAKPLIEHLGRTKMRKKLIIMLVFVLIAAAVSVFLYKNTTVVYRENGEQKRIFTQKLNEYITGGWYDKPVCTMYAEDGRTVCIYQSEIADYENNGWYTEPVVLLYAPENRTMYVKQSEVTAYTSVGWYTEPLYDLYDAEGNAVYITADKIAEYKADGFAEEPPTREGFTDLRDNIISYLSGKSGDWGVYVKSMNTNEFLSINEKPYSSASLIKLFTMAAIYNEAAAGAIDINDDIESNLELMICESSNSACNFLTKTLGRGDTVNGFDTENKNTKALGCQNTTHGSELVTESGGHVIFVGFNRTSPKDCGIILENIYKGTLVSPDASSRMLELLLNQTRTWKIPAGLPEGTKTANKTGENDNVQGDAAIVYSPACDYVICVLGNGSVDNGVSIIQNISQMTYNYFNQ